MNYLKIRNFFQILLISLFVLFIQSSQSQAIGGMMAISSGDGPCSGKYVGTEAECFFASFGIFFIAGTFGAFVADVNPLAGLLVGIVMLSDDQREGFPTINPEEPVIGVARQDIEEYNRLVPRVNLLFHHLVDNDILDNPFSEIIDYSLEEKEIWMNSFKDKMTKEGGLSEEELDFFIDFINRVVMNLSGSLDQ